MRCVDVRDVEKVALEFSQRHGVPSKIDIRDEDEDRIRGESMLHLRHERRHVRIARYDVPHFESKAYCWNAGDQIHGEDTIHGEHRKA